MQQVAETGGGDDVGEVLKISVKSIDNGRISRNIEVRALI